jgi:hypothetical protein
VPKKSKTALREADKAFSEQRAMVIGEARRRLTSDLRTFFTETTRRGHIEPNARTRRLTLQGMQRGSFYGETAATLSQFKSFPIAFQQFFLGGGMLKRPGTPAGAKIWQGIDYPGLAHFIVASAVLGYTARSLKAISKGRAPENPATNPVETFSQAMLQSGGLGLYGDFIIGAENRYGRGVFSTLGGPGVGFAEDVYKIMADVRSGEAPSGTALYNLVRGNIPFGNTAWAKFGLDYGIWFHIQDVI